MKRGATKQGEADITVVTPAFRAEQTIVRAIDSALGQCGGRVRMVVVVDDGSGSTRKLIEDRGDERVAVVMNERNLGAPASRNRGLSLATTPYVAFLDADDFYRGDFLEPLVAAMRSAKAGVGFGPGLLWTPGGYIRHAVPDYRDNADVFLRWFGGGEHVNTASVAWSADYLRSIGGWDEAVLRNQDGELALRAILLGARFAQSSSGAGVWCNHAGPSRISERTDNLGALLDVVDKLQRIPSQAVPDDVRRRATASHLHNIALRAYRLGQDEVGDEAMRRRRELGFADSEGSLSCRAAVVLRALPSGPRRLLWRLGTPLLRGLKRVTGRGERRVDPSVIPQLAGE
jgi:glycosyltransferase involved in cell wall biosynthesis